MFLNKKAQRIASKKFVTIASKVKKEEIKAEATVETPTETPVQKKKTVTVKASKKNEAPEKVTEITNEETL